MSEFQTENYVLLHSAGDIAAAVSKLGGLITPWAKESFARTGQPPLAVCLLRGAMLFFSDLIRQIDCPLELECCRVSFYCPKTDRKLDKTLNEDFAPFAVEGRAVLLVDDFCDSGETLQAVEAKLTARKAADIKAVTLLQRKSEHPIYRPFWSAFEVVRDEWIVGYGLDNKNANRNLKDIYYITGTGTRTSAE